MSNASSPRPLNPPKGSRFGVRPSPRKGSRYIPSRPDIPFQSSLTSSFEVEFDPSQSVLRTSRITDVSRIEVQRLEAQTDADLHQLYEQELRSEIPPFLRYVEQIKVLDNSMRELAGMVRRHCSDQAALMEKVWSSAADLFSAVCKSLSDKVADLEHKLAEKTHQAKHWRRKAQLFKMRYQDLSQRTSNQARCSVDPSHVRQLEEELLLKDKEVLQLQKTAVNLSVWFPRFSRFGDSILSRFLPPVDEDEDSSEGEQSPPRPVPTQEPVVAGGARRRRKNVGNKTVDPAIQEAMRIIRSKQLAQDYLLKDLRRLEQLGIGLRIYLGDVPTGVAPLQSTAQSMGRQADLRNPLRMSVSQGHSPDEVGALNLGLFGGPQVASSFSATNGLEYMVKAPTASFAGRNRGSFVAGHGNDLSHEMISHVASKVANAYQTSSQSSAQFTTPVKRMKKRKGKQSAENLSPGQSGGGGGMPDSPMGGAMPSMQEFYRLQGRKFSTLVENMSADFYRHDKFPKARVGVLPTNTERAGEEDGEGGGTATLSEPPGVAGEERRAGEGEEKGALTLRINTDLTPGTSTETKEREVKEESANQGEEAKEVEGKEDDGEIDEDDDEDDEDDDEDEDEDVLHQRLRLALQQIQALEVLNDRMQKQHELELLQQKDIIQQLQSKQILLKQELRSASASSAHLTRALPHIHFVSLPLNHVVVRLHEMVVVPSTPPSSSSALLEVEDRIHSFLRSFSRSLMADHHAASNFLSLRNIDGVVDSFHHAALDNVHNGQSVHLHSLPLLGVDVYLPAIQEEQCLYSLFFSHYFHGMHDRPSRHLSPKDRLHTIVYHLLVQTLADRDKLFEGPEDRHSGQDVDAEAVNAFWVAFTPSVALVYTLARLCGFDQLPCLADKLDDRRQQAESREDQLLPSVVSCQTLLHPPSVTNTERSALCVGTMPQEKDKEHAQGREDSWMDTFTSLLEAKDTKGEKILHPRRQSLAERREDDLSRIVINLTAAKTITAFDLYLHCYRSLQELVGDQSMTESLIPITSTDALLDRIFRILSSPVGVQVSPTGGLRYEVDETIEKGTEDTSRHPWWRYLPASALADLKRRLYRHITSFSSDHLPQDHDSPSSPSLLSPAPSDKGVPAAYFLYYSLRAADGFKEKLVSILKTMYKFLQSLLPHGPRDELYASVFSYLALCSPLLTHHPHASRHLDLNEDDRAVATSFTTSHLAPYMCSLPVTLLQELRVLQSNGALTESSFAEVVLRACLPRLISNLSPLLFLSETRDSFRDLQSLREKKRREKEKNDPDTAMTLEELGHSRGIAELSRLTRQHIERGEGENAKGGGARGEGEGEEGVEAGGEDERGQATIQAVQETCQALGLGYYCILENVRERMVQEQDEGEVPIPLPLLKQGYGEGSAFADSIELQRFLFPKSAPPSSVSSEMMSSQSPSQPTSLYLHRLMAHARLCFDPRIQKAVPGMASHRFFTLTALLQSFGHVRHGQLLDLAMQASRLPSPEGGAQYMQQCEKLWPALSVEWESIDARYQWKRLKAEKQYALKLQERMFGRWRSLPLQDKPF